MRSTIPRGLFLPKTSRKTNNQLSGITLERSRVVVAGGTSGIGFPVAEAAVVIASRQPEPVEAALKQLPPDMRGEPLDFTDEAQVSAFFGRVGAFAHLVYTAAETLLPPKPC